MRWQKSKRSQGNSNCIEWCYFLTDRKFRVRDSKDPDGPRLVFTAATWTQFVKRIKEDK
jgi:hypothetical protein